MANKECSAWDKAVFELATDPDASITCPECDSEKLTVKDVYYDEYDRSVGGERFVGCRTCKRYEATQIQVYKTYDFIENNVG